MALPICSVILDGIWRAITSKSDEFSIKVKDVLKGSQRTFKSPLLGLTIPYRNQTVAEDSWMEVDQWL